jgi:hypothetical protein
MHLNGKEMKGRDSNQHRSHCHLTGAAHIFWPYGFTAPQRDRLVREWNQVVLKTTAAVVELTKARNEFVDLLRLLQTNDDYILELEKLRLADASVEAIERLTVELRDASLRLRELTSRMQASGV